MPCLPGYQRMSQAKALLLKLLNEGTKAVAQTEVSVLETSGQAWNRLERTVFLSSAQLARREKCEQRDDEWLCDIAAGNR